jgi:hypothetical protein
MIHREFLHRQREDWLVEQMIRVLGLCGEKQSDRVGPLSKRSRTSRSAGCPKAGQFRRWLLYHFCVGTEAPTSGRTICEVTSTREPGECGVLKDALP